MEPGDGNASGGSAAQAGYERLLALLPEPDPAVGYQRLRKRVTWLFRKWGMREAEELADETLDRAAVRLGEGVPVPPDPFFFLAGIARNVRHETVRGILQEKQIRDGLAKAPAQVHEEPESTVLHAAMTACLKALPEADRDLILAYYASEDPTHIKNRAQLAERLGMSGSALRVKACRVRERLERCIRLRTQPEAFSRPPSSTGE